ncbi:MAG: cupin domain-containing protein [Phycisphaerales bacterium]|nr:MAG: cupin domain-containing protein [Phycisphaerales bacterium]
MANYMIADFDQIDPVPCPCGLARRAFLAPDNPTATMHVTEISQDSRVHYHKNLTEIYFILEGRGEMQLDGDNIPVRPFNAILIKPECRHRAVGKMKLLIVVIPPFDRNDEFFD